MTTVERRDEFGAPDAVECEPGDGEVVRGVARRDVAEVDERDQVGSARDDVAGVQVAVDPHRGPVPRRCVQRSAPQCLEGLDSDRGDDAAQGRQTRGDRLGASMERNAADRVHRVVVRCVHVQRDEGPGKATRPSRSGFPRDVQAACAVVPRHDRPRPGVAGLRLALEDRCGDPDPCGNEAGGDAVEGLLLVSHERRRGGPSGEADGQIRSPSPDGAVPAVGDVEQGAGAGTRKPRGL